MSPHLKHPTLSMYFCIRGMSQVDAFFSPGDLAASQPVKPRSSLVPIGYTVVVCFIDKYNNKTKLNNSLNRLTSVSLLTIAYITQCFLFFILEKVAILALVPVTALCLTSIYNVTKLVCIIARLIQAYTIDFICSLVCY